MGSKLSKFVDDTKLEGNLESRGGDHISMDYVKNWQMQF